MNEIEERTEERRRESARWFDMERAWRERELRLKEEELVLRGQTVQALRRLGIGIASLAILGVLLGGGAFLQTRAHDAYERRLAERRQILDRQRFEMEAIAAATTHPDPQQRARNIAFLAEAGYLARSSATARLQEVAGKTPAALPNLNAAPAPPAPVVITAPAASVGAATSSTATSSSATTGTTDREPWEDALQMLKARGYFGSSDIDGRYGDNTKEAVAKFQRERGLEGDGVVGRQTIRAVREAFGGPNAAAAR